MYYYSLQIKNGIKKKKKALQVGGGTNETVRYGLSSAGLEPETDRSGKAQKQLYK
jgi:hypothetical protein